MHGKLYRRKIKKQIKQTKNTTRYWRNGQVDKECYKSKPRVNENITTSVHLRERE